MKSLRARLLVGALLWTAALILVVHFASLGLVRHFPDTMPLVHVSLLAILATGLIGASLWLIRSGLAPLQQLRERLADVRRGRAKRLEGRYPSEVQPLADDLNALLEERERRVARAQAKAGDLAHGLKTPLALLAQEAARLRAAGHAEAALALEEQVARMRGQVDYHLAQARAAVSGASADARSDVRECAEALARAMRKLHGERALHVEVNVPEGLVVRVERPDLDEVLGNLLDNACRFAAGRVVVSARADADAIVVTVDDDGPGIPHARREAMMQRGARADEAGPGSGLGLAIVRDVLEVYGGRVTLDAAPAGGLRATVTLAR